MYIKLHILNNATQKQIIVWVTSLIATQGVAKLSGK